MPLSPYQQLELEYARKNAFRGAIDVLRWDAAVMMPSGSADVRGEQLAALETECHSILVSPRVSRLIERAEAGRQVLEDWQLANLREMRRERDHAIATPARLVARLARATARAEVCWREARQEREFAVLAPVLEEVVALVQDKAALLGSALGFAPYDALVDEFSPGLTCAVIDSVFVSLGRRLPTLIERAVESQPDAAPRPEGRFPVAKQKQLAIELMRAFGFPFDRGRLDESEHPFTGGVPGDIRVTARFSASDPFPGLLAVLHETGHALYQHALPGKWRGQPVGADRGMCVHESQALFLEMVIGRSLPFLTWLAPVLARTFGLSSDAWQAEAIYRRLIRVARGPIRVSADELTYPVHIMMRYDLEQRLLAGELPIAELPDAWAAEIEARLGVRPADDLEGCLQDIHWSAGAFGYFPSYAIGEVLAAQVHEALRTTFPGLDDALAAGRFAELTSWLRETIHEVGSSLTLDELVETATGRALSATAWLRHAEARYLAY